MSNVDWPDNFHDLIFLPRIDEHIDDLAAMAEPEDWAYEHSEADHRKPILYNYIKYTYKRLAEEDKIAIADDGRALVFNTGLVTSSQEPIFCYCTPNNMPNTDVQWHFTAWKRKGDHALSSFSALPEMAHYFDDPTVLVLDPRKELRVNVEHVIADNKERFPEPYRSMDEYPLQGTADQFVSERLKHSGRHIHRVNGHFLATEGGLFTLAAWLSSCQARFKTHWPRQHAPGIVQPAPNCRGRTG